MKVDFSIVSFNGIFNIVNRALCGRTLVVWHAWIGRRTESTSWWVVRMTSSQFGHLLHRRWFVEDKATSRGPVWCVSIPLFIHLLSAMVVVSLQTILLPAHPIRRQMIIEVVVCRLELLLLQPLLRWIPTLMEIRKAFSVINLVNIPSLIHLSVLIGESRLHLISCKQTPTLWLQLWLLSKLYLFTRSDSSSVIISVSFCHLNQVPERNLFVYLMF